MNLILRDDATLEAQKGITVSRGNALNIYAQSTGDRKGKLYAGCYLGPPGITVTCDDEKSGIGGCGTDKSGNITINGGDITACGGKNASGIGGGGAGVDGCTGGDGGTIEIGDEAEVYAYGGDKGGAGIGGGRRNGKGGAGGTIKIEGGTVEATNYYKGAAIGGGFNGGDGGDVTISGGVVTARAVYSDAQIIGHGYYSTNSSTLNLVRMHAYTLGGELIDGDEVIHTCRGNDDQYVQLKKCDHADDDEYCFNCDYGIIYYSYLDAQGEVCYLIGEENENVCNVVVNYTGYDAVKWTSGWYAVTENTSIEKSSITVEGDVHLILCDDAKLTAAVGITVNEGNTLTIYAGKQGKAGNAKDIRGSGMFYGGTKPEDYPCYAGIGGSEAKSAGTIKYLRR